jgi:hypothetical protein
LDSVRGFGYPQTMRLHQNVLSALCLLFSSVALAGLGDDASSIQADALTLGGRAQVTQHPQYRRHEISLNWAQVREFSGGDGKVFAVAWRGKKHPDLTSFLGSHLADFQTAIAQARKTHHHGGALAITLNALHVEMGGHMGAIYGRVWLTDQIPSELDLHEIK